MLGQGIGEPRRGPEHAGDEGDEVQVLPQQREQPRPAVQIAEEAIEGDERGVRIFGARDMIDQDRHQFAEHGAGRRPLERARGAGEPAPHRRGSLERVAEPHFAELVEGLVGVGIGGKHQAAALGGARRRVLEQAHIVPLHGPEMGEQDICEGVAAGVTEETREPIELDPGRRQRVGLFVRDHLQAMLDFAQEQVGAFEIVVRRSVDPAAFRQRPQRHQRLAAAQLRVTAAGDELLGLDEEFDLADAAAAELDVVALDRDLAMAAIGLDLPLHLVDIAERGEIEILAPDERREVREHRRPGRDVAGTRTRLDHRRAFPVLAPALVIVDRRGNRDRDLGR
jgi:hypothetical protein